MAEVSSKKSSAADRGAEVVADEVGVGLGRMLAEPHLHQAVEAGGRCAPCPAAGARRCGARPCPTPAGCGRTATAAAPRGRTARRPACRWRGGSGRRAARRPGPGRFGADGSGRPPAGPRPASPGWRARGRDGEAGSGQWPPAGPAGHAGHLFTAVRGAGQIAQNRQRQPAPSPAALGAQTRSLWARRVAGSVGVGRGAEEDDGGDGRRRRRPRRWRWQSVREVSAVDSQPGQRPPPSSGRPLVAALVGGVGRVGVVVELLGVRVGERRRPRPRPLPAGPPRRRWPSRPAPASPRRPPVAGSSSSCPGGRPGPRAAGRP